MKEIRRELKPLNCGQKSFYQKAYVIEHVTENGITRELVLESYGERVAYITFYDTDIVYIDIADMHSVTTKRHIRDFIIQHFDVLTWQRIDGEYRQGRKAWVYPC